MKKIAAKVLLLFSFVVIVLFLQEVLKPNYCNGIEEGNLIEEYYSDDKKNDVIFIGDCEVYENFSPVTLYNEYGITSYIRGSAKQTIWQSYYLLRDTYMYENPKVVIYNVLSMKYDTPIEEAYNRMTLDGMRWSVNKIKSIEESMGEDENFLSYVFPILRFHSRWNEVNLSDITKILSREQVSVNGFLVNTKVTPVTTYPKPVPLSDYTFSDTSYEYLDKIRMLCEEHGSELILVKAPSIYPYWYEEWDEQIIEYADKNNIKYINFLDINDVTGIDYNTDTYDAGLHLNVYGAEKLSVYLGQILRDEYLLKDNRGDSYYDNMWNEKIIRYEEYRDSD